MSRKFLFDAGSALNVHHHHKNWLHKNDQVSMM